eukprot:357422-Chlamydomonas_euryale.AAC.2
MGQPQKPEGDNKQAKAKVAEKEVPPAYLTNKKHRAHATSRAHEAGQATQSGRIAATCPPPLAGFQVRLSIDKHCQCKRGL